DIRNWVLDSDVDSVEMNGPFAPGSQGITQSKSSGRVEWRVAEVGRGKAVLEFPAPGALARFVWTFEDAGGGTRITQRVTLSGERMAAYVENVGPALEAGVPAGMRKLRQAMEAAFRKPAK